ncbi:MAG: V-type ATP synthase subunit D [Methanomicrobiales archaeon]|nr:V-type ATP synthase subunit D [Methanomicrobiales archaeon]
MKIKLTQAELKRQRDALRQYERYLPTLQLKKQLLQLEIVHQAAALHAKKTSLSGMENGAGEWAGLLDEAPGIGRWLVPGEVVTARKNIAGIEVPVFDRAEFPPAQYDLFLTPLWVDTAVVALRGIVAAREEIRVMEEGISVLTRELRVTTQRVNLFEKVKIPEATEAIRLIKISLGDQMTNAVGRSKIAKAKIDAANLGGLAG